MQESKFFLSADDQKTYRKWRRGVQLFYVSIGVVAVVSVIAIVFLEKAVRYASE